MIRDRGTSSRPAPLRFGGGGTDCTLFAGRPTELRGAESIVGPFVNNLPMRLTVESDSTTRELLQKVHTRVVELSAHQFIPFADIRRCSDMPSRHRLFDSVDNMVRILSDHSEHF